MPKRSAHFGGRGIVALQQCPECVRRALHKACGGKRAIAGQQDGTGRLVL
ncbi:MAG: hypothetical protein ACR2P4_06940 [Gammaproteobacteria bacterium]